MACTSAAGTSIPPFVIFDRKSLNPQMTIGEVPGTLYGLSQKGWIDRELFRCWFFHHSLMYIPPVRPVLLLLDGHLSHYCPDVIKLAAAEKVIILLILLYSSSSYHAPNSTPGQKCIWLPESKLEKSLPQLCCKERWKGCDTL